VGCYCFSHLKPEMLCLLTDISPKNYVETMWLLRSLHPIAVNSYFAHLFFFLVYIWKKTPFPNYKISQKSLLDSFLSESIFRSTFYMSDVQMYRTVFGCTSGIKCLAKSFFSPGSFEKFIYFYWHVYWLFWNVYFFA